VTFRFQNQSHARSLHGTEFGNPRFGLYFRFIQGRWGFGSPVPQAFVISYLRREISDVVTLICPVSGLPRSSDRLNRL